MSDKYDVFDNAQRKQKNIILIWAGITITALSLTLGIVLGSRQYLIYKTAPYLDQKLHKRDICFKGFDSIIHKNAIPALVKNNYIEAFEKLEYKVVDLEISSDSYRLIKAIEDDSCKIIVKDSKTKGHGLRSFVIKLEYNPKYEFEYKIIDVSEVLLENQDIQEG